MRACQSRSQVDADVFGCALDHPVVLRELQGASRVVLQLKYEARFFATVQTAVAALFEIMKARCHLLDIRIRGRQLER